MVTLWEILDIAKRYDTKMADAFVIACVAKFIGEDEATDVAVFINETE
jgi:hypothetical protein